MLVTHTLHIALWTLRTVVRERFFWIWSSLVLGLVLSLDTINVFDFEGDQSLVFELFLSTVGMSAAVNSVGFQLLVTMRQKRQGTWDGILAGPATPLAVVAGMGSGFLAFQSVVALLLGVVFFARNSFLGHAVPDYVWSAYVVRCLEVLCLSGFHLAVAMLFSETWALILMVGGYVLGHLSEQLYRLVPTHLKPLLDVVYCIVPDLEALGHLNASSQAIPSEVLVAIALSSALYVLSTLLVTSVLLPWTVASRRR